MISEKQLKVDLLKCEELVLILSNYLNTWASLKHFYLHTLLHTWKTMPYLRTEVVSTFTLTAIPII